MQEIINETSVNSNKIIYAIRIAGYEVGMGGCQESGPKSTDGIKTINIHHT